MYESGLLICMTPLQALIGEKIIEMNPHVKFDTLMITSVNNEKYTHYYNKLKKICNISFYYIFPQSKNIKGFKDFLIFTKKLKSSGLNKQYDNLYLSNINSKHIQYIVSTNKKAKIYTFDDGTANIINSSDFYTSSPLKPFLLKNIVWSALGVRQTPIRIRNESSLHYTIYPNVKNINENLKLIELHEGYDDKADSFNSTVRIFLGQPLNEISSFYTKNYLSKILNILNIDCYFPHPRENYILDTEATIINSHLIVEDYLLTYITENPKTKIELYSFSSGALLNMNASHQIKSCYIYDSYCYSIFHTLYEIAERKFGIPSINIESPPVSG